MIRYNIYSGNRKINKTPLNTEDVKTVLKQKYISKFNSQTGNMDKIDTKNLHIIRCYVV